MELQSRFLGDQQSLVNREEKLRKMIKKSLRNIEK